MIKIYLILYVIVEILISAALAGIWAIAISIHQVQASHLAGRAANLLPVAIWAVQFWFFLYHLGLIPRSVRNSYERNS